MLYNCIISFVAIPPDHFAFHTVRHGVYKHCEMNEAFLDVTLGEDFSPGKEAFLLCTSHYRMSMDCEWLVWQTAIRVLEASRGSDSFRVLIPVHFGYAKVRQECGFKGSPPTTASKPLSSTSTRKPSYREHPQHNEQYRPENRTWLQARFWLFCFVLDWFSRQQFLPSDDVRMQGARHHLHLGEGRPKV